MNLHWQWHSGALILPWCATVQHTCNSAGKMWNVILLFLHTVLNESYKIQSALRSLTYWPWRKLRQIRDRQVKHCDINIILTCTESWAQRERDAVHWCINPGAWFICACSTAAETELAHTTETQRLHQSSNWRTTAALPSREDTHLHRPLLTLSHRPANQHNHFDIYSL